MDSPDGPTFPFAVTRVRESIIPTPGTVANAYIEFDGPLDVVRKQLLRGAKQLAWKSNFFLRSSS